MSIITGDVGSFSSGGEDQQELLYHLNSVASIATSSTTQNQQPSVDKRKRNPPGNPDPNAEVIALSPKTLMAKNRFVCEICNKGFQRDQNLQLHRRGHNLPWKLGQRRSTEIRKRVYVCPEPSCVHHNPARALGDLTGIKKHFYRKHGEKKWKCDKCSKRYAVQSDWKAHSKICGTKEYTCDCGTIFSRRDSFISHRAFCDALVEESNRSSRALMPIINIKRGQLTNPIPSNTVIANDLNPSQSTIIPDHINQNETKISSLYPLPSGNALSTSVSASSCIHLSGNSSAIGHNLVGLASMSATALLQKAAQMGATATSSDVSSPLFNPKNNLVTCMATSTIGGQSQCENRIPLGNNGGVGRSTYNIGVSDQTNNAKDNIKKGHIGGGSSSQGLNTPTSGANIGVSKFEGGNMTVDFLGVGGKNQEMELAGIGLARMEGLNHFVQEAAAMLDKPVWHV